MSPGGHSFDFGPEYAYIPATSATALIPVFPGCYAGRARSVMGPVT